MRLCTICAYTHTIQVWGIVAFVLVGSFHNLLTDKRKINSTLSYFYNPPHWSCTVIGVNIT